MRFARFLHAGCGAALFGSQFMPGAWYAALSKPAWTPPNGLFGPAWTILYIGIAIAGWLIWRNTGGRLSLPLLVWGAQLVLNGLWSYLFFGLERPAVALIDSIAMLIAIVLFIILAWPVSHIAALLFVPYALWVGFATALNFAIWRVNTAAM
ncbi:MAG: TspO/MBR family protein [Gammaproteobacteria bacterium]